MSSLHSVHHVDIQEGVQLIQICFALLSGFTRQTPPPRPPSSTSPGSGRQVPAAAGPRDGGPRGEGAGAVRRLPPRHGPLRAAAVRVVGAAAGLVPRVQGGLHQLDAAPAASGRPQ